MKAEETLIRALTTELVSEKVTELTDGKAVVIDGEVVSLERYQENAHIFAGTFSTSDISDWIDYIHDYKTDAENTMVFIDPQDVCAEAILDMGTPSKPLHKRSRAKLHLTKLPIYDAVINLCQSDTVLNRQQFENWLRDWSEDLEIIGQHGNELSLLQFMNCGHNEVDKLIVKCHPYEMLDEVVISMDVKSSILLETGEARFRFRLLKSEKLHHKIVDNFASVLLEELSDDIKAYAGNFSTDRDYSKLIGHHHCK